MALVIVEFIGYVETSNLKGLCFFITPGQIWLETRPLCGKSFLKCLHCHNCIYEVACLANLQYSCLVEFLYSASNFGIFQMSKRNKTKIIN